MSEPVYAWCPDHEITVPVVDEFDTDQGDVDPTPVHVVLLDCGDQIVTKQPWLRWCP